MRESKVYSENRIVALKKKMRRFAKEFRGRCFGVHVKFDESYWKEEYNDNKH